MDVKFATVYVHEPDAVVMVRSQVGAFSGIGVVHPLSENIPQFPTTWSAVRPVSVMEEEVPFAETV